ncbi:hypothetical protein D3C71_2148090 [compost metagenome]
MSEVNAVAEGFNHAYQIVIRAYAVRTGAHGETIVNAVDGLFQPLHIFNGRDDARQAEDWARWIVRMNRQA